MAQIFYIGGSSCSGKSSAAASIAATSNLSYFKVDDNLERYLAKGSKCGKPACAQVYGMTADQIWMREPALQSDALEKGYSCIITDGAIGIDEIVHQVNKIFGLSTGGS